MERQINPGRQCEGGMPVAQTEGPRDMASGARRRRIIGEASVGFEPKIAFHRQAQATAQRWSSHPAFPS